MTFRETNVHGKICEAEQIKALGGISVNVKAKTPVEPVCHSRASDTTFPSVEVFILFC